MRKLSALLAALTLLCGLILSTGTPASATGAWAGLIPLSYAWSVPGGYSIYAYCGSADDSCAVVTHQVTT